MPLYPRRVSVGPYPTSRCFKISKLILFAYSLGAFQSPAFVLNPWVKMSMFAPSWYPLYPLRAEFLFFYSVLGLQNISPIRSQSQMFGGLSFHFRSQGSRCLMCGVKLSILKEKLCNWTIPLDCDSEIRSLPLLNMALLSSIVVELTFWSI